MPALYYNHKRQRTDSVKRYEQNDGASQTLPDETLSIRDLLARYQSGMPLERKKIQYFDEEDISAISKYYNPGALDLTDLDELSAKVTHLNEIIEKAQQERVRQTQEKTVEPEPETDQQTDGEE